MCCLDCLRVSTEAPRQRLPDEDTWRFVDDLEARRSNRTDPNALFYSGKLYVPPSDKLVDQLLDDLDDNTQKLESGHQYIQWLFPMFSGEGVNAWSSRLSRSGAAFIRSDTASSRRLLRAYKMMLHFYGLRLVDERTGAVERHPASYADRLAILNGSLHNHRRLTRIAISLGELGFHRYRRPLIELLRREVEHGLLPAAVISLRDFWLPLLDEASEAYEELTLEEEGADREDGCLFQPGGELA
jgi:hypothetical protein